MMIVAVLDDMFRNDVWLTDHGQFLQVERLRQQCSGAHEKQVSRFGVDRIGDSLKQVATAAVAK
jgi:hypothetical protein